MKSYCWLDRVMSKSKNTIEPSIMIDKYGADAVRLFILSDSPPEKDVQWSEEGMQASYKFIQKLWGIHKKIIDNLSLKNKSNFNNDISEDVNKFTNQIIHKISNNIEKFSYNVIIANLYEVYNFLIKKTEFYIEKDSLRKNYINILSLMMPIIPHFAQECLNDLNVKENISWPVVNKKYLQEDNIEFVIQSNGKKRLLIKNKIDSFEKEIYDNLINTEYFRSNYKETDIKKIIFVKNRLMNLIIN